MKDKNWINGMSVYFYGNDIEKWEKICKDAEEGKVPTITLRGIEYALVRHGKWISHGSYFTCSVCGEEQYGIDTGRYYCQNCGAKMDQEESDEADISGND